MIAKKCDRCGILYEQYNIENKPGKINWVSFLNLVGDQIQFRYKARDLCPKCSDELLEWWDRVEQPQAII